MYNIAINVNLWICVLAGDDGLYFVMAKSWDRRPQLKVMFVGRQQGYYIYYTSPMLKTNAFSTT